MTIDQQLVGWKIFLSQVEQASKEGLILCLGDMNINLEQLEEPKYYLKKLADEYQLIVGECGLEILSFGITWNRVCRDAVVKSAVDQAFTNKSSSIHKYFKFLIDYSDHDMICVDLNMKVSKSKVHTINPNQAGLFGPSTDRGGQNIATRLLDSFGPHFLPISVQT